MNICIHNTCIQKYHTHRHNRPSRRDVLRGLHRRGLLSQLLEEDATCLRATETGVARAQLKTLVRRLPARKAVQDARDAARRQWRQRVRKAARQPRTQRRVIYYPAETRAPGAQSLRVLLSSLTYYYRSNKAPAAPPLRRRACPASSSRHRTSAVCKQIINNRLQV